MFHHFPWPSLLTFTVVVHSPSHIQLFVTPRTATHQASMSLTISWSLSTCPISCPLYQCRHPANSSSDTVFFCPQSFPASGTFPMSQLFTSSDQNAGASASASVLPMSIQGWIPLRLTGLIYCCPRDSQESSPAPEFKGINALALCLLHGPALTTVHDYWEDHSLDYSLYLLIPYPYLAPPLPFPYW